MFTSRKSASEPQAFRQVTRRAALAQFGSLGVATTLGAGVASLWGAGPASADQGASSTLTVSTSAGPVVYLGNSSAAPAGCCLMQCTVNEHSCPGEVNGHCPDDGCCYYCSGCNTSFNECFAYIPCNNGPFNICKPS